jgi:uncharacterized membrane protein
MRWRRRLELTAAVSFILAYAGLSHYSNSVAKTHDLGVGLAVAPPLTVGLLLVWRSTHAAIALLAAAGAVVLLIHYWPLLEQNFTKLYLLQEGGFYAVLAASFGQSLLPGRTPLCTVFADRLHGPLSAQETVYTRRVTAAWSIFFVAILLLTLGLFAFAPLRVWSFFANFCAVPLMGLMFVAEYVVRHRVLPQVERRGILASVRVYFASPNSSPHSSPNSSPN